MGKELTFKHMVVPIRFARVNTQQRGYITCSDQKYVYKKVDYFLVGLSIRFRKKIQCIYTEKEGEREREHRGETECVSEKDTDIQIYRQLDREWGTVCLCGTAREDQQFVCMFWHFDEDEWTSAYAAHLSTFLHNISVMYMLPSICSCVCV